MELGELIDVPIPEQDLDPECPFSHEKPNPNEKNELGGIGSKLGTNLAGEVGVHTSKPPRGGNYTRFKKVPDPREPPRALTHVYVFVNGRQVELDGAPLPYPLTCAAHHLIPAQEALKGHPVLKFMCKEGETQDFRNSGGAAPDTVPGALVWGNVAYNVNGGQNGVWLPGNYAVGAGVGGVEVWKSRASDQRATFSAAEAGSNWESAVDLAADTWAQLSTDPQEEEGPQPGVSLATALASASMQKYMLAGENYNITPKNPKWGYVKSAMDEAEGQFHDRHADYSGQVKLYLKKIAEAYQTMYDRSVKRDNPCPQCEEAERPSGAKKNLLGPPYGIVGRLVQGSNFFSGYVKTTMIRARNIYTSKWVKAWMDSR